MHASQSACASRAASDHHQHALHSRATHAHELTHRGAEFGTATPAPGAAIKAAAAPSRQLLLAAPAHGGAHTGTSLAPDDAPMCRLSRACRAAAAVRACCPPVHAAGCLRPHQRGGGSCCRATAQRHEPECGRSIRRRAHRCGRSMQASARRGAAKCQRGAGACGRQVLAETCWKRQLLLAARPARQPGRRRRCQGGCFALLTARLLGGAAAPQAAWQPQCAGPA